MNEFEIDIIDEKETERDVVQLPMNYLLIGEVDNDDIKIYIKQDVYNGLEKYATSDTTHELGTIILGNYSDALGKINVIISDYIIAKYTEASSSTLTFTHETWDYVNKEHEEKYPNTKIVGWQHTHPGYGIFLSNYDMFIQENFFKMPFQVAYVIDPIQHIRGFFQWKNGKVEKLKGFYIYDEVGKQIKIESSAERNASGLTSLGVSKRDNKLSIFGTIIQGLVILALIVLLISTISLHKRYNRQIEEQEDIESQLLEQNNLISQQSLELQSLKMSESNDELIDTEEMENTENAENLKEQVYNRTYFFSYEVKVGDTLLSICNENNIDYESNYRIILAINGIEDENHIYAGQVILLPVNEQGNIS